MSMTDITGRVISVGDTVAFVPAVPRGGAFQSNIYTVKCIINGRHCTLEGCTDTYGCNELFKVNIDANADVANYKRPSVESQADKIIALINSRPWSPTRQEIIEALASEAMLFGGKCK